MGGSWALSGSRTAIAAACSTATISTCYADSFLGDPLFDTSASLSQQRSSLFIRIQETSANLDEANALAIRDAGHRDCGASLR